MVKIQRKSSDEGDLVGETAFVKARAELYMLMYKIAREHKDIANKIASNDINDMNNEIKESMISILFSYTCLEAYINTIGKDKLGNDWQRYEVGSTESKWMGVSNLLSSKKKGEAFSIFSKDKEPLKSFLKLEKIREDFIIHRKGHFGDIVSTKYGNTEGTINVLNSEKAEWACKVVKGMIEQLCNNIENPPTTDWLN
jgi:hypothetical protein